MKAVTVDVVVLGAGTAGLNARRGAEKAGATTVMVDPGPYGTTCARVGCMPSKLLIAAADVAHTARDAGAFGVRAGDVAIDGKAVMARVRSERDRFTGFVVDSIDRYAEAGQLIRGRGSFTGPHTLQVDDHTEVRFKTAVIATGSSPFVPPPFRDLGDALLDNEGIFDLETLPDSILVVGTGVIGLELGQALHRLGVRTTLVGIRGVVGPLSDPKVKAVATEVFGEELDFRPDYTLERIERNPDGSVLLVTDRGEETFSTVLMAAGRRPNLANLNVDSDDTFGWNIRELPEVDERTGQVGNTHIFLAGDVSNFRPLLHEAADEGRQAGANAAKFPNVEAKARRTPLGVVFTDPQIGIVGESFRMLEAAGKPFCAGDVDYSDQGRARVNRKNRGWVRIYGDCRSGVVLGAEMFGPGVEHTAHLLAWAIQRRQTVHELLEMPFYHPVVEEGLRTALQSLRANLKLPNNGDGCAELESAS